MKRQSREKHIAGSALAILLVALTLLMPGCKSRQAFTTNSWLPLEPSNDRDWSPDQALLARAKFKGDKVTVYNIRNCDYRTADDYTVRHYDKKLDLDELESVDFIVVPLPEMPGVGHTMISFGFSDGYHLAVSVEVRKEKGETYAAMAGAMRQFEIMYVVGDERDLIRLRTDHYLYDVHLYATRATPEQAREMFTDVMGRVNELAVKPEFYDTLTNNCTTNIVRHVNRLAPGKIPLYDHRVILPGNADALAYELGILDTSKPFAQTKEESRINYLAYVHHDAPDFSVKIRR